MPIKVFFLRKDESLFMVLTCLEDPLSGSPVTTHPWGSILNPLLIK